jgi:hypothetical protein
VTTKSISGQENNIYSQYKSTNANAKGFFAGNRVDKPECLPDIIGKKDQEEQGDVKKVTMYILNNKRKGIFSPVALTGFCYRAGGRIGPERFIIGTPVIITGKPEQTWSPEYQDSGGPG